MALLALDDTDALGGGCTTHVAWRLACQLGAAYDLVGHPRLVRLNPDVPHKTRGNAALVLQFGHGQGTAFRVGADGHENVLAYPRGSELTAQERERLFAAAQRIVRPLLRLEDERTHPALVMTCQTPPPHVYTEAVHRYVGMRQALTWMPQDAQWTAWKQGRGIVGALAACAWPGRHGTYEAIAYRHAPRWGTPRELSPSCFEDRRGATFDSIDPETGTLRAVPNTPCPVLAGVRGLDPKGLTTAAQALGPETAAGHLVFATNQATDDHAPAVDAQALRPFMGATVTARVTTPGLAVAGGHTWVRVHAQEGVLDAVAFGPTGPLRAAMRSLRPGDVVRLQAGISEDPTRLAVEKAQLLQAAPQTQRRPPCCPACGKRMKSRGTGQGYRCIRCRTRSPHADEAPAPTRALWSAQAPTRVRRHLTRPLDLVTLASDLVTAVS